MAHDAPPTQKFPPLADVQPRSRVDTRLRLVPLPGPRIQSTTVTVSMRALTLLLAFAVLGIGLADSTIKSTATTHLVCWFTASLFLLCALAAMAVGGRPTDEGRRYLRIALVALFVGLSWFEAAPRDAVAPLAGFITVINSHPVIAIVIGAFVTSAVLAVQASRNGTMQPAPAAIVYITGLVACSIVRSFDYEHPTAELVMSLATVARMLGPVLALRALLRYLSPPEQPAALRFVLLPFRG